MAFLVMLVASPSLAADKYWVTSDRLNRRTCPSTHCGIVGQLFYRQGVTAYEERDGWARISKHYDASCRDGKSWYVDSGNAACIKSNGIVQGRFAEWISMKYLSKARPDDPSIGATGNYALVKGSDDYRIYKDAFAKAASELIASGQCTEQDFRGSGGWMKSTNWSGPVYFIYCGRMHISNRLYLNAATGKIYR